MRPFPTAAARLLAVPALAALAGAQIPLVDLGCDEFDRYEVLTPNDTLTLVTTAHNPEQVLGFAVVYAVDEEGAPISRNVLVGQQMAINGIETTEWAVNALDFRAVPEDGAATDLDGDGVRDLDGAEYELAPDELLVPRFLGQSQSPIGAPNPSLAAVGGHYGRLILVDLNSGREFDTIVDFLSYNDNEEVFSAEYAFNCWDTPYLAQISGAFTQDFLVNSTAHDPSETLAGREAGWFRFEGHVANSSAVALADPAVYGVYVERVGNYNAADLPFEAGSRVGHLLPRSNAGDNSEGAQSEVEGLSVSRRRPGSLLVFPEFDNRFGALTLFTITNTSPEHEVRLHFVYYGKYGLPPF